MSDDRIPTPDDGTKCFWADGGGLVISQTRDEISVQLRQKRGWSSFSLSPENASILQDQLRVMLGKD